MPDSGPTPAPPITGWQAQLDLSFAVQNDRTILAHRQHTGPLLVQRPFYPEREVCHVYIIHPPGGIVGGDQLHINVNAQPGSHALLTTPAAGKFYRSGGPQARQTVDIKLEKASLEWLPQETIFYPETSARTLTRVKLDEASRLIAWEVGCFGLPARKEVFSAGQVVQGFEVWLSDRPLLHDRLRLNGGNGMMQARWGLAAHPVIGTMLAYPADKDDLEVVRNALDSFDDECPIGVSLVDGLLICRALDRHADAVQRRFVAIWQLLRPRLLGRPAMPPRIWAT